MEAHVLEKRFPVKAEDYKLYEEVGEGVSATVYRALCVPLNQIVAIKVLDLERCNNDLDGIRREVQTMSLIDHPNVLRAHCSFTTGYNLWVVMPYMAGGSCLHIMKSAYPEGFEEPVIATLLRETLRALVYLHSHGHIHRDVKAGNILIDSNGAVKLADFGVSAGMFDTGDRQRSRNTFVGTPCWMAPEVMQQLHGYDFKADIWSFGITALELAHGHAPFSKYPPMKVLLMTLQNAPPGLDYERDKRFSKSFKELVAACLVKDPKKRPTSEKLLKHHFFKHARSNDFLACTILDGLPPLGERFRVLKAKEADLLVQNKAFYENKDHLSQQEYIKGISAWNFNLDDLKAQAALIQDNDIVSNVENPDVKRRLMENQDKDGVLVQDVSHAKSDNALSAPNRDGMDELIDLQSSLASFPIKPLQALKGCFDMGENEEDAGTLNLRPASEQPFITKPSEEPCQNRANIEGENLGKSSSLPRQLISENKFLSGSLLPDVSFSPRKVAGDGDRELLQPRCKAERSYSGPLLHRQKRESNSLPPDDATEGAVVTRRGRFQVTSTDLSPKVCTNSMPNQVTVGSTSLTSPNPAADAVLPSLQLILQQNIIQREEIIRLIRHFELLSGKPAESTEAATSDLPLASPATTRERELQYQVTQLQQSIVSIVEELQRQKEKNAQLEKQLNALANKECNEKETFWR